jgi:hypothetical protein
MGLRDFVNGGFPLPHEPVYIPGMGWMGGGIADFVNGGFPLPATPVYMPAANGSLPKAPPMPRAAIAHGGAGPLSPSMNALSGMGRSDMIRGFSGVGGCGCGSPNEMVRGFSGMGLLATTDFGLINGDTIIPQASLPTILQGDNWVSGIPNLYTAIGVGIVAFMVMGGKKGRR